MYRIFIAIVIAGLAYKPVRYSEASLYDEQPGRSQRLTALYNSITGNNGNAQKLRNWQTLYKTNNGHYVQMSMTHRAAPPAVGDINADYADTKPSDAPLTPAQIYAAAGSPLPTKFRQYTHIYSGPLGDGFTTYWETVDENAVWRACEHVGPESYRDAYCQGLGGFIAIQPLTVTTVITQ